ncbi:MAG: class I SAM-dependent methyltransferase [Syntrophomonadaceae bacterium]|nr:class I SAM-dependent methyltransferase [Syntrophomonadaceae bacterium]
MSTRLLAPNAVRAAHRVVQETVRPGATVLDATCGNGHDTVFLARLVGPGGVVHAIDVQPEAVAITRARLEREGLAQRVRLYQADHRRVRELVPDPLQAAMFNLGYRPRGDKCVVTRADSTLEALEGVLALLAPGGVVTLVGYLGHHGGREEWEALCAHAAGLDQRVFQVLQVGWINQVNQPPQLMIVQKLGVK